MNYVLSMLAVLAVGMFILMAGILMNREPGQSFHDALKECVVWGIGFFISFSAEIVVLATV